ncbi:MAG: hypothetical protein DRQ49_03615 [Gammaproteobacteria bacterium]|nr:MAG: hypothetical protein DRQ49_03615 [Gammaproteobacteria bacterium]RKZ74770.1 MAG: hypothetical protein DRQ57_09795 [Gammaproteobacteria bacterium]
MKIHYLLKKLAIPLFLITLFFIFTTFMAELSQGADWQRVFGINLHRILELLDLREENTLATWFSSMIFFATGLAFLLLGWGSSPDFIISHLTRFIFKLTAIGAILLSADEVASIHETVGKSFFRFVSNLWANAPPDNNGYFWVVLFAPFMLGGLLMTVYFLHKVIARMPTKHDWQRQLTYFALLSAFMCLPGVFVFELFEWYFNTLKQGSGILTCFEETFEIIGMYSLFLCATLIAKIVKL